MVLFWGLITIPDWGYINTPCAMLELMMSDLPHIMYHPKKNDYDDEQVKMMDEVRRAKLKNMQKKGLSGFGLKFNFREATGNDIIEKK